MANEDGGRNTLCGWRRTSQLSVQSIIGSVMDLNETVFMVNLTGKLFMH